MFLRCILLLWFSDGQKGKILDKRYSDWHERPGHCAKITFQPNHWFDWEITLTYLKWLVNQFEPNTKIGLIWDQAPSHKETSVQQYLEEQQAANKLFTSFIPAGLTSIVQVSDL